MLDKHTNVPHNKVGPGQWVHVQLGELSPRTVDDYDRYTIWCSVQVEAMVVGDVKLDMGELDCHISIGTWFMHASDEGPSWDFMEAHERWADSLLGGPGVEGFELEFEFKCVLVFWTRFLVFWYFSELR